MAIFHFTASIKSRGTGACACAAMAYIAGAKVENEWDGNTYDYTHRKHVAYTEVMLPEHAPQEYHNAEVLWNAVEKSERQCNAQLARAIEFSLPVELPFETQKEMAQEYIQCNFVDNGMCCQYAIHDNEGNPHVHCLLTLRPIGIDGKWAAKKQKLYWCEKDGEQRLFSPTEFKKVEGWEKLYYYKDELGKKSWHTKSYIAEHPEEHLTQVNKYPKCENIVNPTIEKWNSKESLLEWRANWANQMNLYYERYGYDIRVSQLSYSDQGLQLIPTIHEGKTITHSIGDRSDVRKLNLAIREYNEKIRLLYDIKRLQARMDDLIQPLLFEIRNREMEAALEMEKLRIQLIIIAIRIAKMAFLKAEMDDKIENNKMYLQAIKTPKIDNIKRLEDNIKSTQQELNGLGVFKKNRKEELAAKLERLERELTLKKENLELDKKVRIELVQLQADSDKLGDELAELKQAQTEQQAIYDRLQANILPEDVEKISIERQKIRAELEAEIQEDKARFKIEAAKFDKQNGLVVDELSVEGFRIRQ